MDKTSLPSILVPSQLQRLERFGVPECVDIHCHCLPGLDDGPRTLEDALSVCRALVADGVTHVIATPHQMGRYEGQNSPADVRVAVSSLQSALIEKNIPLTVAAGGDVRVDHRYESLLEADAIGTLADTGRYVLLELPHETYIEIRQLSEVFTNKHITLIVSHPERHMVLSRKLDAVKPWLETGAVLQVTAGSLLGNFGPIAQAAGWKWLEAGQVHLIASDAHNTTSRPPNMSQVIDKIAARLGEAVAKRVCMENPTRVFRGKDLLPGDPKPARRWFGSSR